MGGNMTNKDIWLYLKSKNGTDDKTAQLAGLIDRSITSIVIPSDVIKIGYCAFSYCTNLKTVAIHNGVTEIRNSAFSYCTSLTDVTLPNTLVTVLPTVFQGCTALELVTLENNFDCNGLDLSPSNKYSKGTIVAMLNALSNRSDKTAYTLKLGNSNLAKLSDEDIAIATNKNWTLA